MSVTDMSAFLYRPNNRLGALGLWLGVCCHLVYSCVTEENSVDVFDARECSRLLHCLDKICNLPQMLTSDKTV